MMQRLFFTHEIMDPEASIWNTQSNNFVRPFEGNNEVAAQYYYWRRVWESFGSTLSVTPKEADGSFRALTYRKDTNGKRFYSVVWIVPGREGFHEIKDMVCFNNYGKTATNCHETGDIENA